jgi:hypothetical protein
MENKMISIIHPSRSRPEMAKATMIKWLASASNRNNIEYILSLDYDDPRVKEYERLPYDKILIAPNKNAIQAINHGAKWSKGDLLIVVSDDFDCPYNWDLEILKATEGKEDFLLRCKDGLQNYLVTLPIMDRKYYQRFGYIYHYDYAHMFADTEMTCVADLLGKIIDLPILFKHNHHSQTGKGDSISKKNDATWKHGEDLFIEHSKRNFYIPIEDIKGKISDKKMIDWLRRHGVNNYA